MTTLDTIIEMQKKGMTDFEISSNLQTQGIAPREINEGLNQARIKNAISDIPVNATAQPQGINPQTQQQTTQPGTQVEPVAAQSGIQPTTVNQQQSTDNSQAIPLAPQTQIAQPQSFQQPQSSITQVNAIPGEEFIAQEPYPQEIYPQDQYGADQDGEEYYGDEYYGEQEGGYTDTETITEIAEQVIAEKFKEYNTKTGDIVTFKTTIQDKINNIEQRVKRIEDTIDKLQHAILQKVGEFTENSELIKKDLENLHNTTSKLMNPLVDNYRELQKLTQKKHRH